MPLPEMHGRTHIPAGYAAVVQPTAPAAFLPQATSDQIPCVAGGAWTGQSASAYDSITGSGTGTINNNTLTSIYFDQVSIGTGVTAIVAGSASPGTSPLKLDIDGWYFFYLNVEWAGVGFADVRYYDLHFSTFSMEGDGNQDISAHQSAPFEASFHGTWGPLYCRVSAGHPSITVKLWHQAGSTQTLAGVLLSVIYLGPDIDPARFPPF